MNNLWIIAQTETGQEPARLAGEPVTKQGQTTTKTASDPNIVPTEVAPRKSLFSPWILLVLMAVMVFTLFRGPRKKQQEQKKMVQSLEKNDKVRTIGGIIGTLVDIKGDEITLKIDESNNTKIKVLPSAIGKNVTKDKN